MSSNPQIILYNPQAVFHTMPLGLLAVGSALDPSRYDVKILDARLGDDLLEHIDGALCVGMSVLTGAPIRDALQIARQVKLQRPDLPVVWGGWHPSLFGRETLEEAAIDVSVQGQGEETFRELVDALAAGRDLSDVNGITYRAADGSVRANPPREMVDMNSFPPHQYGLLPVERYFSLKARRQFDYISSTGCFWRCAFCADPFVFKRKWTAVSTERMTDEIELHWRRYRFEELAFQDETFFTYRKRVVALAEAFLERGFDFRWTATMRADQGFRLSEHDFSLLKQAGLHRVLIGVESGSQEMIDWMQKDITLEQVMDAAEKCVRHGIGGIFPFIVGFPNETAQSVASSLDLAKKLRAMSPRFETPFFYFKPYPGSRITSDVVRAGYALPTTLDGWANFDYIGSAGPWVDGSKYEFVERFKFYNRVAGGRRAWFHRPLQRIARWRCERDFYDFPLEKVVVERLKPLPELS